MNSEQHELLVRIDERVEGITSRLNHLPCEAETEKYAQLSGDQILIGEKIKTLGRIVWLMLTFVVISSIKNLVDLVKG